MSDDADRLIHRHLEGELSEADAAALGARVKGDPAFRRRLAEMAFDRAQMRDVLSKLPAAVPAEPVRFPRRAILPMAAAAMIVASVGIAVAMWSLRQTSPVPSPGPAAPPPPEERLFSGAVRGRILARTETSASFRVSAVPGRPGHRLVGSVIHLVVGWTKNGDGDPVQDRSHTNFIRKLAIDQEETVDVRQQKDDIFAIGELTPAQLEWANRREERRDPVKRMPDRPRRDAAPKEGSERDAPPKERPKEQE